jgi:uncharacterized protein
MYKYRWLAEKIKRLAEHFSVVVLTGARQVGKSTLLGHLFPALEAVVFDPVKDVAGARQDPDLFLDNHPTPLFLDEIQYAPELVPAIKRRVDLNRRPGSYILTGSQQWSVMKSISESLAGRAVFATLEGFSLGEIAGESTGSTWLSRWLADPADFMAHPPACRIPGRTLNEQLWRGWLPEADRLPLDLLPEFHAAYLRTYLERDVRLLAGVEDWQVFGRFVQLAAALTACEVNYSQLGRDIGVTPQTARRWLTMLRATFQWHEVPAYSGNAVKRISGKSKGYLADTGMACHLLQLSSPAALSGHPQTGALFESAVLAEIRKMCALESTPPALYHWRSHGGAEVDLILERDGRFYPIEIKLTTNPARKDTMGLSAFRKTYPGLDVAPGLVITPGQTGQQKAVQRISEHDCALSWQAAAV